MICLRTLHMVVVSLITLAWAAAAAHAEPRLASPGFKFMAVGGGEATATFPITVATPSTGLDLHIRLGASAGGTFSVVLPGGATLDAAAITGMGGRFIDLTHDAAWGQPDPVLSLFMIPSQGRVVDIHVPGPLAAGTYGLRVDYSVPLAEATAFQVNWDTGEALRTALFVEKSITFDDDHLMVAVTVTEGTTPLAGATVECAIVAPDGDELNVVLRDDGDAPDGAAGDGLYSAGVVPEEPGLNLVRVTVSGATSAALGSVPFSRTMVKSIEVCRRGANFGAGPFVTRAERAPTNLVTAIVLDVPVDVVIEGDYILSGKLHSP